MSQPNQTTVAQTAQDVLRNGHARSFGMLQIYPDDVSFQSQNPNEVIYILMRSHFMVNLNWVVKAFFFSIVPVILWGLYYVLGNISQDFANRVVESLEELIPVQSLLYIMIVYFAFVLSYIYIKFMDWYFDLYLVTNERILHMDFQVFTGKFIAEAPLTNIEDISQNIIGLFPSIFDYGDVLVQTAAEKSQFLFKAVSDPSWFRDVLSDLANIEKANSDNAAYQLDQRINNLDMTLRRRSEYFEVNNIPSQVDPYYQQRRNVPVYPNIQNNNSQPQTVPNSSQGVPIQNNYVSPIAPVTQPDLKPKPTYTEP